MEKTISHQGAPTGVVGLVKFALSRTVFWVGVIGLAMALFSKAEPLLIASQWATLIIAGWRDLVDACWNAVLLLFRWQIELSPNAKSVLTFIVFLTALSARASGYVSSEQYWRWIVSAGAIVQFCVLLVTSVVVLGEDFFAQANLFDNLWLAVWFVSLLLFFLVGYRIAGIDGQWTSVLHASVFTLGFLALWPSVVASDYLEFRPSHDAGITILIAASVLANIYTLRVGRALVSVWTLVFVLLGLSYLDNHSGLLTELLTPLEVE